MDRRRFLQIIGAAGVTAAIPWRFDWQRGLQWAQAQAFATSPALTLWNTPLRGVGPGGIPVAAIDGTPAPVTGIASHYTIDISEFTDQLHPALPNQTRLWGYNPVKALGESGQPIQKHLGGIIVAKKGTPIQITFQNRLSVGGGAGGAALFNIIPVDTTVIESGSKAQNRTAVHLHGGHIPWYSDGGPFDWFDHAGTHGPSFMNNVILNPTPTSLNQAEYYYNMDQSARLLWYHDHAYGITRINAYAGIASVLVLRDKFEGNLVVPAGTGKTYGGLPEYIETSVLAGRPPVELPLVFQDKIFVDSNTIGTSDPTWSTVARPDVQSTGSLWYAHVYEPARWRLLTGGKFVSPPNPSVIAEFFGDTMLTNGTVYPTVQVEARPYRLRLLNACNARFLNLQLYQADASPSGITLDPNTLVPISTTVPYIWKGLEPVVGGDATQKVTNTSKCLVIGSEGGFLTKPVAMPLNAVFNPISLQGSLLMAPAERLDVLIDFSGYAQGTSFILYSDTPAPFPVGDPINDFLPNPTQAVGPNTREILKITVGLAPSPAPPPVKLPPRFDNQLAVDGDAWNDRLIFPNYLGTGFPNESLPAPGLIWAVPRTRKLTLNETFDKYGRLTQMLGTTVLQPGGTYGQPLLNIPTETPKAGTTEIWEIYNLTGDTHPIHFHLVDVQVLSRQAFVVKFGQFTKMGTPRPPEPIERGWKETVRMNPGEVTRVAMTFTLPATPPNVVASDDNNHLLSPRTPGGYEYAWHCHILEHEEHDMMRPLVVKP